MNYPESLKAKAKQMDTPVQKVLAISGSPRTGGNTDIILHQILAGLKDKFAYESVNLSSIELNGCIGCEKCRKDKICTKITDGMTVLYPDIMASQALILGSPVHNYNITSWMKAFIDRLYCFYEFNNRTRPREWSSRLANQNRKVVITAVCEQAAKEDMGFAMEAMQKPMEALGYEIVGLLPVFNAFEKGAVHKQKAIMNEAYELGTKLGSLIN